MTQQLAARIDYYHQAQQILGKIYPSYLAYSLRLQAYRYDIKGLMISAFGNTSFAGVYREMEQPEKFLRKTEAETMIIYSLRRFYFY